MMSKLENSLTVPNSTIVGTQEPGSPCLKVSSISKEEGAGRGVKGTINRVNLNAGRIPVKPERTSFVRTSSFNTRWRRKRYEGQALLPAVIFILLGVLLLGVVVEVGNLFIARRQLQNDADAAAALGAMQLDMGALRISDGSNVHVLSPGDDQNAADQAGNNIIGFMSSLGYDQEEWNWQWGRCTLQINIKRQISTVFISIVGVTKAPVAVTAKARLNNTDQKVSCG